MISTYLKLNSEFVFTSCRDFVGLTTYCSLVILNLHCILYFRTILLILCVFLSLCNASILLMQALCPHLQACQLPLFSYIVERLCACCYEQAWYAKLGGVVSIKFLMERLPLIWVLQNQLTFLKALLFVMMDLTGEVRLRSNF